MSMSWLNIVQIVIAIMLIGVVLLQPQGTGLGRAYGGSGTSYRSKRGMERLMFWLTIILAVLFAVLSVINVLN